MNAPILAKDALKLLSMAIEDCDKATEGPWVSAGGYLSNRPGQIAGTIYDAFELGKGKPLYQAVPFGSPADAAFCALARATMRPMLEYLRFQIGESEYDLVVPRESAYQPLAALRVHYDAVRPGWRKPVMEKCVECGTESIAIDMGRCPPCQSNEASRR